MAYNIPIMSGLKIPNEEELVNLTPEQRAAINKLYLLHSKHVEVDCIKPKRDENGNIIVDEDNNPEVEREYVDLATVLGQLAKTSGVIHWNSNGLNETEPDKRLYPDLEINYDEVQARIQEAVDNLDISEQVNDALVEAEITDKINSISATLASMSSSADRVNDLLTEVEAISTTVNNANATVNGITDTIDTLQEKLDNLYNYNYLDNSNFENPVNQRKHLMTNEQYQSGSKSIYTIDRWFLSTSSTLLIKTDTIEINGTLTQAVQRPSEDIQTWTVLATKIENNQEIVKKLNIDLSNNEISFSNDSGINVFFGNDFIFVSLLNGEWKNIGLYKGNYKLETWMYISKPFNEELFNCMKYFYHYEGRSQIIIEGFTILNIYGFIPIQMRVLPTITGIDILKNIKFRNAQIGVLAPVTEDGYLDNSDIRPGPDKFDYEVNLVDYLHLSYNSVILEETRTSTSLGQFVIPLSYDAINYHGETRRLWYNGSGILWSDSTNVSTHFGQLSIIQTSVENNGVTSDINIGQWYASVPSIKQDFGGSCFISIDFSADFGTNIE